MDWMDASIIDSIVYLTYFGNDDIRDRYIFHLKMYIRHHPIQVVVLRSTVLFSGVYGVCMQLRRTNSVGKMDGSAFMEMIEVKMRDISIGLPMTEHAYTECLAWYVDVCMYSAC